MIWSLVLGFTWLVCTLGCWFAVVVVMFGFGFCWAGLFGSLDFGMSGVCCVRICW